MVDYYLLMIIFDWIEVKKELNISWFIFDNISVFIVIYVVLKLRDWDEERGRHGLIGFY